MVRYSLAAGAALIALALAGPAAASGAHSGGKHASAAARCAAPIRAGALGAPLESDSALEAKVDQLTNVISELSERLASLEQQLGASADGDSDDDDAADAGADLASARAARQPGLPHRPARSLRAAPRPAPHASASVAPAV